MTSTERALQLLREGLQDRKENGDFEDFDIEYIDNVIIHVGTGRSYRLHTTEVKQIIIQRLCDIKTEMYSILG